MERQKIFIFWIPISFFWTDIAGSEINKTEILSDPWPRNMTKWSLTDTSVTADTSVIVLYHQWMYRQWLYCQWHCIVSDCILSECIVSDCIVSDCIVSDCIVSDCKWLYRFRNGLKRFINSLLLFFTKIFSMVPRRWWWLTKLILWPRIYDFVVKNCFETCSIEQGDTFIT